MIAQCPACMKLTEGESPISLPGPLLAYMTLVKVGLCSYTESRQLNGPASGIHTRTCGENVGGVPEVGVCEALGRVKRGITQENITFTVSGVLFLISEIE